MSSKLPKRALIAITSHSAPFYPDGSINGMFYTEVLHPFQVLSQAGFEIDLASETGTYTLDPYSVTEQFISGDEVDLVKDPASPLNKLLTNSVKKASDVRGDDYGLFFASAGFATVYDYPNAKALQAVAESVWERGGVIAAVCHGGAIFPGIKDAATGKSIIANKKVTGFSTEADKLAGVLDKIHADGVMTTEESAVSAGANYVAPPSPFAEFAVTDGRVISGANPFSAHATAVAALEAFEKI